VYRGALALATLVTLTALAAAETKFSVAVP
jgi:hypothetical protein